MINPGELVAIVGAVGAGKSSLLMTMLGEMPVESGSVNMAGKVAYVPQEAWIFSGSVQDNILFGQRYDHERFQNIINATALDKDLETFEHGSQSIVGENGHYLSGGQKARINLARAIYQNADIYLLDDPLSAVDSKVARYLFQRCIRGELEGKTRVLVTHQLQFLKQVDNIIVMDEGRILSSGSYGQVSLHPDIGEIFRLHDRVLKNDRNMTLRRLSVISLNGHELEEKTIVKEESKPRSSTEEISIGSVGFSAYCQYFSAGNGIILFPLYLLFTMGYQVIFNMTDWILIRWNKNNTDGNFIYILAGLILGLVVSGSLRSLCFFLMASNSSRNLHNKMFGYLTRAPISFFDSNPAGRILNRFTRDTGFMDDILPQSLHTVFLFLMKFAGVVVFVSISNPWSLLITAPIFMFIMFLRRYCLKTMRDLKRLEASCRSPMFSHLSTTLQGLMVIRAFKMEKKFIDTFYAHQDLHTSAWQMFLSAFRWFSLKLDWCITLYLTGYIFAAFVLSNTGGDGAYLGLSLSYIVSLLGVFQYTMRLTAEVESYMTSVERILHYTKLDQEAAEHTSVQPDPDWPANGTIHFDHLYLSYTHGQYVLKDINIIIDKGEKIGIVGRTGAGKTSLLSCLFRLCEPSKGKIWMDGIDIGTLGLVDLRKKISIIPQDPVLFQATLRYNLDPFSEHSDESIWKALEEVELSSLMKTYGSGLESNIAESGSSLSVGQKQLVCLARAILRNNKILVIDEATANVDLSTDRCIQAALKRRFKNCTVLCIAHRINTVIDCDRILVLDQGEISQFGAPYALLQDQESIFYEMVHQTGKGISQMLYSIARNCYEEKLNGKLTEENEMTDDITLSRNTTCVGAEVSDELSADLDITGFANLAFVNDESIATYL